MASGGRVDFFDRARHVAVAILLAAGAACVIGGVLDWATLERCPEVVEGSTFDDAQLEDPPLCPVRGVDTTEGKAAVAAGFVVLGAAILLIVRPRPGAAWLALLASMVAGSFAISAYRGIGDANSSISRRLDLIDAYDVGIGLTLVAVAAVVALLASVAAIAATPRSVHA